MSAAMRAADTVQLWLCDQGAALTWSAGSHWIGPPGPEATHTSPAEPQTVPRASGWRCDEAHLRQVHRYKKWEFKLPRCSSQTNSQLQSSSLTSPIEVLSGVPARQSKGQRNGSKQLDDVSNVIWTERVKVHTVKYSAILYSTNAVWSCRTEVPSSLV